MAALRERALGQLVARHCTSRGRHEWQLHPTDEGAIIEITDQPHTGCAKFSQRFGIEAHRFVNSEVGKKLKLPGVNARVVVPDRIRPGDVIRTLCPTLAPCRISALRGRLAMTPLRRSLSPGMGAEYPGGSEASFRTGATETLPPPLGLGLRVSLEIGDGGSEGLLYP
jgi:hypothetical protein